MNGAEQNQNPVLQTENDLLQLQLLIAQRADELARSRRFERSPDRDWQCWLDAEREVMARRLEQEMALVS